VKKITPSMLSVMPTGLAEGIGEERMRDLMTFLLTEPLKPAPIERTGAPPPRTRAEVERVLRAGGVPTTVRPEGPRPVRARLPRLAGPLVYTARPERRRHR
jgi:hypothetical protein